MTRALICTIAFLVALSLGGLAVTRLTVQAAAQTPVVQVTKQAVLANIAKNVLLPGYVELASTCNALSRAADGLALTPNPASLASTQRAWVAALLAWRRTQAFTHGPILGLNVQSKLQFWPPRPQSIDRVLRDKTPIGASYVEELGAGAVGLAPLETLIFDSRGDQAALAAFVGPQGERRRQFVRAVANQLAKETATVEKAWQGPNGYAASFAAGGQDQLNTLVNDVLAAIETGAQERLRLVIDWQSVNLLNAELVEGGRSGTSQQGLLALVQGADRVFSGGQGLGLDDYLSHLKSPAAQRMTMQFRSVINAVRGIGIPLDRATAATEPALKRAQAASRDLEVLLKTEVASTLGVTLTFKSTDGD